MNGSDAILAAIESLRKEMNEKSDQLKKEVIDTLNTNMKKIEEDVTTLKQENENLKEKLEKQDQRIRALEKEINNNQLVIHGLEELETPECNLEKTLTNFFQKIMKINFEEGSIEKATRLGPKKEGNRPIKVTIKSVKTKDLVMANRKQLKGSAIYISENYPKEVLETRKKLVPELKKLRNEGKTAYINYDKLVVKDKHNSNSKRPLSDGEQSPDHKTMEVNRANKQQKLGLGRKRAGSVTSAKYQNIKDMLTVPSSTQNHE